MFLQVFPDFSSEKRGHLVIGLRYFRIEVHEGAVVLCAGPCYNGVNVVMLADY